MSIGRVGGVALLACLAKGRRSEGLGTGFERRRAGALVLMFVVACGGADGSGWRDVDVDGAGVDDAGGVDFAAVVVAAVGEDGVVCVKGAGSGDNAGGVVVAAAAVRVGVDIDGAGVAGDAIIAVAIAVVITRSRRGVSDVGGAGLRVVEVEGEGRGCTGCSRERERRATLAHLESAQRMSGRLSSKSGGASSKTRQVSCPRSMGEAGSASGAGETVLSRSCRGRGCGGCRRRGTRCHCCWRCRISRECC